MEEQKVLISFPNEEMTAREYLAFSKKILFALKAFSDDFKQLYAWGSESNHGKFLKEDLSDFEPVVFEQIGDDEIAFVNPDVTNKDFTLDSKSFIGFSNSYSTNKDHKQNQITLTISAGEFNSNLNRDGFINFEFSKSLQDKITLSKLQQLVFFTVELLNPINICTISNEFRRKVRNNNKISSHNIGWINYFSDNRVFSLLPADIQKKQLPNGGCIFWLSEEKPLSTDESMVQKAIKIRETLDANNIL